MKLDTKNSSIQAAGTRQEHVGHCEICIIYIDKSLFHSFLLANFVLFSIAEGNIYSNVIFYLNNSHKIKEMVYC